MSDNKKKMRTAEDTTIAELLTTTSPPREETTGVHLTAIPPAYLLTIQGPDSARVTRHILEFVDALFDKAEEKKG